MTAFRVEQSLTILFEVDAETPEAAAQIVRDGDAGYKGEVYDSMVASVTHVEAEVGSPDLRNAHPCRSCGKLIAPFLTSSTCVDCLLATLSIRPAVAA
jgi:hypothetical protein